MTKLIEDILKNSKTNQPHLSNLVQMDEKTSNKAKINKKTLSVS